MIDLPAPAFKGRISLEETLHRRRTVRSFAPRPLNRGEISQLLWSTYGVNDPRTGKLTSPSAGALYPLDCYLTMGAEGVEGLGAGVYHYLPFHHALEAIASEDKRRQVARASLDQQWMVEAPIMVIITAAYQRTTEKYRERGIRYVYMEVGHAGENLFLQSVALGLGAGIVGAFDDDAVTEALELPAGDEPLLIIPIGHPR